MKDKKKNLNSNRGAPTRLDVQPYKEAAIPVFLCLVCMAVACVAWIINKFVYPFGETLLAPVILELLAIVFPCYLVLLSIYPKKSAAEQMRSVGFHKISPRYVFFMLFAALFLMGSSMAVSIIFGGVYSFADGLTLLGTFVAGSNEYTNALPYLILAYVIVPAIAEELLLRGVILSQLDGVGFAAATAVSALASALLGFSLGGAVPAMFVACLMCFVFYTTGSVWACIIVRLIFNLYRLFLESNISAYYVSLSSRGLFLTVLLIIFLISGALFFGESARIYRESAASDDKENSKKKTLSFRTFTADIKRMALFGPTVALSIACAAIFLAVVVTEYIV